MATDAYAGPGHDAVIAVRALLYAAAELPIEACQELARQLVAHVAVVTSDFEGDIARRRPKTEQRAIDALRALAAKIGHAPNSVEYTAEYEQRRDSDGDPIPSASAIVKRFGSWQAALAAAGLAVPELGRINVRRYVGKKSIYRYPDQRLTECLRACARDLGHRPQSATTWPGETRRSAATPDGATRSLTSPTTGRSKIDLGAGLAPSAQPGSIPR